MEPATLATISAIAGLAQAGGAGLAAFGAGREARKNRRMQQSFHDDEMRERGEDRKLSRARLGLEADQMNQQRPMSALQFLSGLQDFSEKRSRSGSYLDTVKSLAGR
jgi:hypothetical protein